MSEHSLLLQKSINPRFSYLNCPSFDSFCFCKAASCNMNKFKLPWKWILPEGKKRKHLPSTVFSDKDNMYFHTLTDNWIKQPVNVSNKQLPGCHNSTQLCSAHTCTPLSHQTTRAALQERSDAASFNVVRAPSAVWDTNRPYGSSQTLPCLHPL